MIWCFIGIGLFVLSFVFDKLDSECFDKYLENHNKMYGKMSDVFEILILVFRIVSIFIMAVVLILTIIAHSLYEKLEIQEMQDQHDAYAKLLEKNEDITVQNQLYKDIVEYNSELRKNKHYSESLWTNWFYADGWDKLEYIEIK